MGLAVGLSLIAILVVLLAVPVELHLAVERDRAVRTSVRLGWLFGLVRVRLAPGTDAAPPSEGVQRPARRRSRIGSRIGRRVARGLLRPEFRDRVVAFLRDLVRAVGPRDVRLHARIGLDDPADTGRLWGLLGPLSGVLSSRDVRLEPEFASACLRFRAAGRVRLIPAQLLYLTLAFLLSPPVVRTLAAR